jgi:hypothetical protein
MSWIREQNYMPPLQKFPGGRSRSAAAMIMVNNWPRFKDYNEWKNNGINTRRK